MRGSSDLYANAGRPPAASIDLLVAHDGMTLADAFAYDAKNNGQSWPFGPSGGGTDNDLASSHGGDPAQQRAAARAAFVLATVSAGVPMITGGDERLRTQRGNNNPYNLDSPGIWLDWKPEAKADAFTELARRALRLAHRALRPALHWREPGDAKGTQVTWLRDDGQPADAAYLDATARHFLAWSLDGTSLGDDARAILVMYNSAAGPTTMTLPAAPPGTSWMLAGDTSEAAELARADGGDCGHRRDVRAGPAKRGRAGREIGDRDRRVLRGWCRWCCPAHPSSSSRSRRRRCRRSVDR